MKKVPLQVKPLEIRKSKRPRVVTICRWLQGPPFVKSPRGQLTHRTRSVCSYVAHGRWTHDSVTYWCGGIGINGLLTDQPAETAMLCARCEARARSAGETASEQLLGRCVRIGQAAAAGSGRWRNSIREVQQD